MKINDFKMSDDEIISMGLQEYLMGSEIDNQMNRIDNVYLNFGDIDKNVEN